MRQPVETHHSSTLSPFLVRNELLTDTVEALRAAGSMCKIRAAGRSMYPFLHEDDTLMVFFEPRPAFNVGDVVIIHTTMGLLVHRVIECVEREGSRFCRELGDNAWIAAWHPAERIAGKVMAITRQNHTISLVTTRAQRRHRIIVRLQTLMLQLKVVLPPLPGRDRAMHILRRLLLTIIIHL